MLLAYLSQSFIVCSVIARVTTWLLPDTLGFSERAFSIHILALSTST